MEETMKTKNGYKKQKDKYWDLETGEWLS